MITWRLNNMLQKKQWVNDEIKAEIRKCFETNDNETFSRIDHMVGHKTSLNRLKRIQSISSNFSDHNGIKLEINYRKKNGKAQTCGD